MLNTLLAAGANAAATDEDGKTPLVWAASQGHEAAAGVLDSHSMSKLAGRPLDEASTGAAASYSEEAAGGKVLQADEEAAFMAASMMAKEQVKNEL